jgi:hypothetical protein
MKMNGEQWQKYPTCDFYTALSIIVLEVASFSVVVFQSSKEEAFRFRFKVSIPNSISSIKVKISGIMWIFSALCRHLLIVIDCPIC